MRGRLPGRHVSMLLGVYVLGGLRGRQAARVTAHLSQCDRCRAEHRELAEIPPLLKLIIRDDAEAAGRDAQLPSRRAYR
jgi:anti-sigma factor RsiW